MKDFILSNYIYIMIILCFLLFALIGYVIDALKHSKKEKSVSEVFTPLVPEVKPELLNKTLKETLTNEKEEVMPKEEFNEEELKQEETFVLTDKKE